MGGRRLQGLLLFVLLLLLRLRQFRHWGRDLRGQRENVISNFPHSVSCERCLRERNVVNMHVLIYAMNFPEPPFFPGPHFPPPTLA